MRNDKNQTAGATCQHAVRLSQWGLPLETCGAPAVEHRPDRVFVRYVCANHR